MSIILETDNSNALLFSKIVGTASIESMATNMTVDSNGNIYVLITEITARTQYFANGYITIKKYDSNGKLIYDYGRLTKVSQNEREPRGTAITVDRDGNIYVTGYILSLDAPSTALTIVPNDAIQSEANALNGYDSFIMKLDNSGNIIYSTYFGAKSKSITPGAQVTQAYGIAVDSAGNAWITGITSSKDFYITNDAYQKDFGAGVDNVFVSKINPTGTEVLYSTYLGGNLEDIGCGITIDKNDNVYVVGEADCDFFPEYGRKQGAFPTTENAYQRTVFKGALSSGFVSKFDKNGMLLYSTYLGGSSGENIVQAVIVDDEGNAYVSGLTGGGFPAKNGYKMTTATAEGKYTGFVAKINSIGTNLLSATYIGGDNDYVNANSTIFFSYIASLVFITSLGGVAKSIALDSSGNVYVTGETISRVYPVTDNAYQKKRIGGSDCVVSKFNGCLKELLYSSYIGGSKDDSSNKIIIPSNAAILIAGETHSTNFPLSEGQKVNPDGSGFLLKLAEDIKNFGSVNDAYKLKTGPIIGFSNKNTIEISVENTTAEDKELVISISNLGKNSKMKARNKKIIIKANKAMLIRFGSNECSFDLSISGVTEGIYVSTFIKYYDGNKNVVFIDRFNNESLIKEQ